MAGVISWLSGFLLNPWLAVFGAAAIASPILIHLLNKRKFKKVDWAAMDFLLEADKKNRRRVRLENLLLLLLRCLAILLIGLLLARPFKSLGLISGLVQAEAYERIVLLDDSLSMAFRDGTRSNMDKGKATLVDFVRGLATNGKNDSLTLYYTSDPTRPRFNAAPVDEKSAGEIAADIEEETQVSDFPGRLDEALVQIEKELESRESNINRVLYVISDMRKRDWPTDAPASAGDDNSVAATMRRMSENLAGCYLVDVGADQDVGNIVIEEVRSNEKALVSGVQSQFEVALRNTGRRDAKDVKVRFTAMSRDSRPLEIDVPLVRAGTVESIPFNFTFARQAESTGDGRAEPMPIWAEVIVGPDSGEDGLDVDNTRHFAARVVPGIKTLVVDGDPSAAYGKGDSFFVMRALDPPGRAESGVAVKMVTDVEFENERLDEYQVVYLCNLYRIPEDRRDALEKWVRAGGGLVIALGDQLDEEIYNRELYRDGNGLLPVQLDTIYGDEEEENWVHFNVETGRHPVLRTFEGEGNPFLESVKFFRWWGCTLGEEAVKSGKINVAAHYDNPDRTPAVVEKAFGDGRVMVFTSPLDLDWNNWPQDHSYPVTLLELNKYMARKTADDANLMVGNAILQPLDLTNYEIDVSVRRPDEKTTPLQANPAEERTGEQVLYEVLYDEVNRQGFYTVQLNRRDGSPPERVLFAANIDPREGQLDRADTDELLRRFGDAKISIVSSGDLTSLGVDDAKGELWKWILGILIAVLVTEQVLGWTFGRRR